MHEALEQHIIERVGKRPENLDQVLPYFESVKGKRGEHLLTQGAVCQYVYFIVKGCVQVYVLDKQGKESTRSFYFEQDWVTDIFGFKHQTPSSEFIKCVEPCQLLRIHHAPFQALCSAVPQFDALYKEILEASYNSTVYRINTLTSLSALERIQWLMETKPRIMARLSSKLIASYLGVSPETMTRLKAKL